MALNIELMKQKLASSQNKNAGKSNDTKWRPSEGDQTIRILQPKMETRSRNSTFTTM